MLSAHQPPGASRSPFATKSRPRVSARGLQAGPSLVGAVRYVEPDGRNSLAAGLLLLDLSSMRSLIVGRARDLSGASPKGFDAQPSPTVECSWFRHRQITSDPPRSALQVDNGLADKISWRRASRLRDRLRLHFASQLVALLIDQEQLHDRRPRRDREDPTARARGGGAGSPGALSSRRSCFAAARRLSGSRHPPSTSARYTGCLLAAHGNEHRDVLHTGLELFQRIAFGRSPLPAS